MSENFKLLKSKQIRELVGENSALDKAEIIIEKLKNYLILDPDAKKMYILNDKLVYETRKYDEDVVITKVSKLISESWKNISASKQEIIKQYKSHTMIFKNPFIKSLLSQIKTGLTNTQVKFDDYYNELHFNNGYIDLINNDFRQRKKGKHFITQCVNRDYKPSTDKAKKKLNDILRQIYADEEDFKAITYIIMSAFTGMSRQDQELLFMRGQGSSGKSTFMTILNNALPCYFKELGSNTFAQGNTKADKIINTYLQQPQILISWINEPDISKVDTALFKKFCEGKLQTTRLYVDGSHDVIHKSKAIFTANEMPNMLLDSGSIRRILAFEHKSEFVDDKTKVDHSKLIFHKDRSLITSLQNDDDFNNAVVDMIIENCIRYNKKEPVKLSKNFSDAKDTIVSGNDHFQDFIDARLVISNNDEDRISKDDMKDAYLKMYPAKHANNNTMISALKDKKIIYQPKYRCNNIQGCFVGVKFKAQEKDIEQDDYDYGVDKTDKQIKYTLDEQINITKNQIESLQKKLELLMKQKNDSTVEKTQKKVFKITNYDVDDDFEEECEVYNDMAENINEEVVDKVLNNESDDDEYPDSEEEISIYDNECDWFD